MKLGELETIGLTVAVGVAVLAIAVYWSWHIQLTRKLAGFREAFWDSWHIAKNLILPGTVLVGVYFLTRHTFPPPSPSSEAPSFSLSMIPVLSRNIGGFTVALGLFFLLVGIFEELFITTAASTNGLETVIDQRVHDTGSFADEYQIDAALRDASDDGSTLSFDE